MLGVLAFLQLAVCSSSTPLLADANDSSRSECTEWFSRLRDEYALDSQDGMIQLRIFEFVGATNRRYVEVRRRVGPREGMPAQTHERPRSTRLLKHGWSAECVYQSPLQGRPPNVSESRLSERNVEETFAARGIPRDVDYVAIHTDSSIDIWVLISLLRGGFQPRVISTSFNPNFYLSHPVAYYPYSDAHRSISSSMLTSTSRSVSGASAAAINYVAKRFGYHVVHMAAASSDMFLVAKSVLLAKCPPGSLPAIAGLAAGIVGQRQHPTCSWEASQKLVHVPLAMEGRLHEAKRAAMFAVGEVNIRWPDNPLCNRTPPVEVRPLARKRDPKPVEMWPPPRGSGDVLRLCKGCGSRCCDRAELAKQLVGSSWRWCCRLRSWASDPAARQTPAANASLTWLLPRLGFSVAAASSEVLRGSRILPFYLQAHWHAGAPHGASCAHLQRLASAGVGGTVLCEVEERLLSRNDCAVVSVGPKGDASFEEDVRRRAPHCTIDMYDDSLNLETTRRVQQVGRLFNHRFNSESWRLYRGRTVSLLKLDCAGCEVEALPSWVENVCTEQVVVEMHGCEHVGSDSKQQLSWAMRVHHVMSTMEKVGLEVFHAEVNIEKGALRGACIQYSLRRRTPCVPTNAVPAAAPVAFLDDVKSSKKHHPAVRVIMQTDKHPSTSKKDEWLLANPGWSYEFVDDERARSFLASKLSPAHAAAFASIVPGAIKADFLRLGWLYVHGGVYADIDLAPAPLTPFLHAADLVLVQGSVAARDCASPIYNAFMVVNKPRSPFIGAALREAMHRISQGYDGGLNCFGIAGPGLLPDVLIDAMPDRCANARCSSRFGAGCHLNLSKVYSTTAGETVVLLPEDSAAIPQRLVEGWVKHSYAAQCDSGIIYVDSSHISDWSPYEK